MFPDFNIFSSPLLILVIQGLILVAMLFKKGIGKKDKASLVLAFLLLITCYHRTTYTIGFMGWYDTFRNTKVNYYLIAMVLGIGPLIYLYIKSVVFKGYEITKKEFLHYIPLLGYIVYSLFILIYDSQQPGFDSTQNGVLMQVTIEKLLTVFNIIFSVHLLVYIIFSFQLYYKMRNALEHEYSNTYKYELRWLRNFLFLFTFLFAYNTAEMLIEDFIFDLHWTQEWWYQFFSLLVVLYVGLKGYFIPLENLPQLDQKLFEPDLGSNVKPEETEEDFKPKINRVIEIVERDKLYLDPNLTLTKLAKKVNLAPSQLSQIINVGTGVNFNAFINQYRVDDILSKLKSEEYNHLSILAIALDSGFNSKATFNRVFKKLSGKAPSSFR